MKKNILLTGGSGFLGNLLLKKYKNEFNFICVGKNEKKLDLDVYQYSIDDLSLNISEVDDITILHLATYYSKEKEDNEKINDANLLFGKKVLNILNQEKLSNFIYTNTMFCFDEQNKDNFYTYSKSKFSKYLYENVNEGKVSEIYLDNTFHSSDKRKKVIPEMVNTINSNKENPVQNKNAFINLSYAPDVVNTLVAEIKQPSFKASRITSKYDLNINSIFDYLKYFKVNQKQNKEVLKIKKSKYFSNNLIPEINTNHQESDLYDNLQTLIQIEKN
ncbi:MAG: hypothetical protein CBE17_01760 [Gammaproteobacteria bacterium TMED257]|nr:MAG: hypothetical protein CBE17_01760 [Gammaproteobacteria bacterium TMED257]|tara:strand:+ start:4923 stop:5747 length:825 start_codon:yes stop_codon:yes gene_type:complete